MPSTIRTSLLSLCLLLLTAGCAALPTGKRDPRDPWERVNRATYRFNDKFDRAIARPVARGYRAATPHVVQTGIRNVYDNVDTPIVMLNDLLQGQFKSFASDTGRLLEKVDARSRFLDQDRLIDNAYDAYAFLRNAYLQHRDFKVNGGQSASEEEQELKLMEEAGEDQQAPQGAPPQSSPQSSQPEQPPPQSSPPRV